MASVLGVRLARSAIPAALAVVVSGCRAGRSSDSVRIAKVTVSDDGAKLRVHVEAINDSFVPVYVYAEPQKIWFDHSGPTLTLVMHSVPTPPEGFSIDADCTVRDWANRMILPRSIADLEISLPRVGKRLSWDASTPTPEPWYEAKRIDVELGWSTHPLELPSSAGRKCRFEAEQDLRALEQGVARGASR